MSGCSWHVRNEARFVFAPWDWVQPTPYLLSDNLVEGYDVQVAIAIRGVILTFNPDEFGKEGRKKTYYCWGKRITGSDPRGGTMDRIQVPDWVTKLPHEGKTVMVFRQRSRVTGGHKVWYGYCDIDKPFLVVAGSAWYNTERF